VQLNRECAKFSVEFPRQAFQIDSRDNSYLPLTIVHCSINPVFLSFLSQHDASGCETSRMNRCSCRESEKKTSVRLESRMQMRTGAFRCASPRKRVVARYASPEAELSDFRQNSFSKITVSFVKDSSSAPHPLPPAPSSRCIIRARFSNSGREATWKCQWKRSNPLILEFRITSNFRHRSVKYISTMFYR
jgi:hypothetical protein